MRIHSAPHHSRPAAPARLLKPLGARAGTLPCALLAALMGCAAGPSPAVQEAPGGTPGVELPELARQVEIRRTTWGVPHILAENLRAAAFALAYVQVEDHGEGVIEGINAARGRRALAEGYPEVDGDFRSRQRHARAVETFQRLRKDTRDVYLGFAEGLNHYIRVHRDELPDWMEPDFTPYDVLARDISWPSDAAMAQFRRRVLEAPEDPDDPDASGGVAFDERGRGGPGSPPPGVRPRRNPTGGTGGSMLLPDDTDPVEPGRLVVVEAEDENVGSNAWALAPDRTTSGHAILLRNPHLSWTAGYYEAHVRVPGKLDFYGDFRIGGPFTVIGGFNPDLGFATTNNATRNHEFYAFEVDPDEADHILLDGASVPLTRELVTVEFRNGPGVGTETREFWTSPLGPVVHRADGRVYVYRPTTNGEFRAGEQWLEMMKARNLEEWKAAMRIQARSTSNFTYADRDGNILYVWVAAAPALPHPAGGDSLAVLAGRTEEVWTRMVPFDSLPQLLNPTGGYIHNANDSPHYTNLTRILDHDDFSFWVQEPRLRFRSQHGLELLNNERRFSLEDVVETKHSMRMLLAERVKDDLVEALRASASRGRAVTGCARHRGCAVDEEELGRAINFLEAWDNTVAAESRGGVLFEAWWNRYRGLVQAEDGELHAVEWSIEEPTTTPYGLGEPERAVEAFGWAVEETRDRFGSWDVPWGEVHRVRRGDVDVPVGGCGGALGCYRVLNFTTDPDGKRVVNGGDGWIIAVEFGETPRAYSVLGYGQSTDPDSPFHANQAEMFAANEMKPVHWTEAAIERALIERYRPGEEGRRTLADDRP